MTYFLGIDTSTTSSKSLVIDEEAKSSRSLRRPIHFRRPGHYGRSRIRASGGKPSRRVSGLCWKKLASVETKSLRWV